MAQSVSEINEEGKFFWSHSGVWSKQVASKSCKQAFELGPVVQGGVCFDFGFHIVDFLSKCEKH